MGRKECGQAARPGTRVKERGGGEREGPKPKSRKPKKANRRRREGEEGEPRGNKTRTRTEGNTRGPHTREKGDGKARGERGKPGKSKGGDAKGGGGKTGGPHRHGQNKRAGGRRGRETAGGGEGECTGRTVTKVREKGTGRNKERSQREDGEEGSAPGGCYVSVICVCMSVCMYLCATHKRREKGPAPKKGGAYIYVCIMCVCIREIAGERRSETRQQAKREGGGRRGREGRVGNVRVKGSLCVIISLVCVCEGEGEKGREGRWDEGGGREGMIYIWCVWESESGKRSGKFERAEKTGRKQGGRPERERDRGRCSGGGGKRERGRGAEYIYCSVVLCLCSMCLVERGGEGGKTAERGTKRRRRGVEGSRRRKRAETRGPRRRKGRKEGRGGRRQR